MQQECIMDCYVLDDFGVTKYVLGIPGHDL